jgi:hypothetical protein
VIVRGMCGLVICCLLVFGGSSVLSNSSARQFQTAVVLSVQNHEPEVSYHRKVTDAPAPPSEYDADVSIRLNCVVYLGRYKSAIAYLPGVFVSGQSVEVSPEKPWLYVKVPGTGEVKLRIVRSDPDARGSCAAGH